MFTFQDQSLVSIKGTLGTENQKGSPKVHLQMEVPQHVKDPRESSLSLINAHFKIFSIRILKIVSFSELLQLPHLCDKKRHQI